MQATLCLVSKDMHRGIHRELGATYSAFSLLNAFSLLV